MAAAAEILRAEPFQLGAVTPAEGFRPCDFLKGDTSRARRTFVGAAHVDTDTAIG
jgi:hypothetical protein